MFTCKRSAYHSDNSAVSRTELGQREDVLTTLEMMRESLRETLKETSVLRHVAIQEEVIIRAESIDKTCSNALRYARQIKELLTESGSIQGSRR